MSFLTYINYLIFSFHRSMKPYMIEPYIHSEGGILKFVVHFHKRLLILYVHFVKTDNGNP